MQLRNYPIAQLRDNLLVIAWWCGRFSSLRGRPSPCRSVGARAPGSYTEFATLSAIEEAKGTPAAKEMVSALLADQTTVADTARRVVKAAEAIGDQASADLGVRRIQVHEKNAWMLRSHLE